MSFQIMPMLPKYSFFSFPCPHNPLLFSFSSSSSSSFSSYFSGDDLHEQQQHGLVEREVVSSREAAARAQALLEQVLCLQHLLTAYGQ
jgi:hypothetical protein